MYLVELCTYRTLNIWNVTIKPRHIWFCCLLLWLRGGSQRAREKVGNTTKQNHWQWTLKTSTPMIPRCLRYFNVSLPQCLLWKNAGLWTNVLMIPRLYLGESLSARWRQCNIQSSYFNTTFLVVSRVFLCCGMSSRLHCTYPSVCLASIYFQYKWSDTEPCGSLVKQIVWIDLTPWGGIV